MIHAFICEEHNYQCLRTNLLSPDLLHDLTEAHIAEHKAGLCPILGRHMPRLAAANSLYKKILKSLNTYNTYVYVHYKLQFIVVFYLHDFSH